MRLTQKLLGWLHRVFDTDPEAFLALRLRYDGGMTWSVSDGILTTRVVGGSGGPLSVDLAGLNIGGLAAHLAAQPGYSLAYVDGTGLSVSAARVLLDAEGDIAASNGDHLYGYTSTLWTMTDAVAVELRQAALQIPKLPPEMDTRTADGEWLDLLGSYYAVLRRPGELDQQYGNRIIAEVLRPRGNNVAIEIAIEAYTGQQVTVTDVTSWGNPVPAYNGLSTHNGVRLYNASASPKYGLFDVAYAFDLLGGEDGSAFQATIRSLIERLRDAGTHLRALTLTGSRLDDVATPPTDGGALALAGDFSMSDALSPPAESAVNLAGSLAALTDALDPAADDGKVVIAYQHTHNGMRRYNGAALYASGLLVTQTIEGDVISVSQPTSGLLLDFSDPSNSGYAALI